MRKYSRKTVLHSLLDKVRMTQKMFAAEVGVEPSAVSLWMSGKRFPNDEKIDAMSRILQVEPGRLKAVFIAETLLIEHGTAAFIAIGDEMNKILSEGLEEEEC